MSASKRIAAMFSAAAVAISLAMPAAAAPEQYEVSVQQEYLAGGKVSVSKLSFSKIEDQAYTGKAIKPAITVKSGNKILAAGTDYTLSYKNNTKLGTATVTVTGKGNYTGTKKLTFKIVPGTPALTVKESGKKLSLSWSKAKGAAGYQLYYSVDGGAFKKLATTQKTKYTFSSPKAGTSYVFKVRAYKKVSGKTLYGAYSDTVGLGGASNTDKTLTILSWEGNSDVKRMVENFCKSKGNKVDVKILSVSDYGEGARDGYRQYMMSYDDADLIVLDTDFMAQYINSTLTLPLSSIGLNKSDLPEAYQYTLDLGTNENGVLSAVSPQATPGAFVYRADLAKEYLGVDSPEEMHDLISDWDKFVNTGKTLYKSSGGKVSLQSTMGGLWQVIKCNDQPWVVNGKLNTANAKNFFKLVTQMQKDGSLANVPMWDPSWYLSVYQGTALGEFLPSWGLYPGEYSMVSNMANFSDYGYSNNGKVDLAICEGPESWYWGGTYFAVANSCNSSSLAKEFLQFTCGSSKSMKEFAEKNYDFANNSSAMSKINFSNPWLINDDYISVLADSLKGFSVNVPSVYDSRIDSICYDAAYNLVNGYFSTTDEALQYFKNEVAASFPDIKVK